MSDDCDCGDCDCDLDCCDCDCSCDDCLPGSNVFILCFCIPPTKSSEGNKINRADAPVDCCCFCCNNSGRRSRHNGKRRRRGCCCWRLWCCFARNEPSPPPSPPPPPRPTHDGRYPMPPEDLDFYMNDSRVRRHDGRYPMPPREMRMYRDKYSGHGIHKDKEMDQRSRENYLRRRNEWDERDARKRDSTEKLHMDVHNVKNVPLTSYHGHNLIKQNKEKLKMDCPKPEDNKECNSGFAQQDQMLQGRWSTPTKYEEYESQRKD